MKSSFKQMHVSLRLTSDNLGSEQCFALQTTFIAKYETPESKLTVRHTCLVTRHLNLPKMQTALRVAVPKTPCQKKVLAGGMPKGNHICSECSWLS